MNNFHSGHSAHRNPTLLKPPNGETSFYGELFRKLRDHIFHFGFDSRQSVKMFYFYFARMFLAVRSGAAGIVSYFARFRKLKRRHVMYLFLIFYFVRFGLLLRKLGFSRQSGSGQLHDRKFIRALLAAGVLGAMPFASYFIMLATRMIFPKWKKYAL